MKRILITGGAGSVGRGVAACLAARGHRVRVFDLPGCDFGPFEGVAQVQIVRGDIRDRDVLRQAVSGVDAAAAALDDGCEALVIDVAGPRQLTVVESDLVDLAGRDRLQHACSLIARYLDEALGAGQSTVSLNSGVVRVECEAEAAHEVATDLGSAVRIHALVPGGVEIHPRGARPVD